MDKFASFSGIAMPLEKTDVDTDQIIPAQFMKRVTKTGYEDALFHSWRQDPTFILNKPQYEHATVLVAGASFGTGSSREHAVWALRDYGFRAVFSPRFADIFRGNAGKQGLLAAQLPQEDIDAFSVDLDKKTVSVAADTFEFDIDDYTRWQLLEGLDEIGTTLQHLAEIDCFEKHRPAWLPTTLPVK